MRGGLLEAIVAGGGLLTCQCAFPASSAANAATPMAHLGLATQPVALPGVGQIILVFICVAALAVGIAAVLRRLSPGLLARLQLPTGIEVTVLGRQRLEPGVSLHIVSVAGERLAIVTSRSGVAMQALLPAGTSTTGAQRRESREAPAARRGTTGPAPPGDRLE